MQCNDIIKDKNYIQHCENETLELLTEIKKGKQYTKKASKKVQYIQYSFLLTNMIKQVVRNTKSLRVVANNSTSCGKGRMQG